MVAVPVEEQPERDGEEDDPGVVEGGVGERVRV
jgi:hypothetical protein